MLIYRVIHSIQRCWNHHNPDTFFEGTFWRHFLFYWKFSIKFAKQKQIYIRAIPCVSQVIASNNA